MTPRREDDEEEEQFEDVEEVSLSSWDAMRRFLRSLSVKVQRLNTDVYVGRDANNPSVTTRLDRIERALGLLTKILATATVLSVTALLATLGQFIVKVIHP